MVGVRMLMNSVDLACNFFCIHTVDSDGSMWKVYQARTLYITIERNEERVGYTFL